MKRSKLFLVAVSFTIVLVLWPVLTMLSAPAGDLKAQLQSLHSSMTLYSVNFAMALLIGPLLVLMILEFIKSLAGQIRPFRNMSGQCFLFVYLVLISVSYGSQVFGLPFLLRGSSEAVQMRWYFYNPRSWAAWLNQTGYLVWSAAVLLLFFGRSAQDGLKKSVFMIICISATVQIIASIGLYAGNDAIHSLTVLSGILLLPAGILISIIGYRKQ